MQHLRWGMCALVALALPVAVFAAEREDEPRRHVRGAAAEERSQRDGDDRTEQEDARREDDQRANDRRARLLELRRQPQRAAEETESPVLRVFPRQTAEDAAELAVLLRGLSGRDEGLMCEVIAYRNCLVVYAANNQTLKRVEQLLSDIDRTVASGDEQPVVKVYCLAHANAGELASVVASVFNAVHGQRVATKANKAFFRVTEDERTNSLIVYASPEQHEAVEALVAHLDTQTSPKRQDTGAEMRPSETPAAPVVCVVKLAHVDAQIAVETLEAVFEAQGEEDALSVVIDERADSLLLFGDERHVDVAKSFLAQLDATAQTQD